MQQYMLLQARGIERTSARFVLELCRMAYRHRANASALAVVVSVLTDGTFNPYTPAAARTGAVGILRFLPSTALALGTSAEALVRMSALQQLEYVERYFAPYWQALESAPARDYYLCAVYPPARGWPDSATVYYDPTRRRNVTVGEMCEPFRLAMEEALTKPPMLIDDPDPMTPNVRQLFR